MWLGERPGLDRDMSVEASGEIQLLIMMSAGSPDEQVEELLGLLSENGSYGRVAPGHESLVIGAFGDREALKGLALEERDGVESVLSIRKPYKLVSSESAPGPTVIQTRGRRVGGDHIALIAGSCTSKSRESTHHCRAVEAAGASILPAGRSSRNSPYRFRLGSRDRDLGIAQYTGLRSDRSHGPEATWRP